MQLSDAIRTRRSIRKYRPGVKVPRDDLEKILEAAMMAPSACNTRPWSFVVVQDDAMLEELAQLHPYCRHVLTAGTAIVVCGLPPAQSGICAGFWPQDCGAAVENILLQALELGYGTCWCGVYPNEERAARLQTLLGVDAVPVAVVTVGEADEAPKARGFFQPEKVKYI